MDLTFTAFELVCISLGAGASFLLDSLFILSSRYHKIKPSELKLIRRLSLMSLTGSFGAIVFYGLSLANVFQGATDMRISIFTSKIIMLAIALLAGLAIRKVHLKALMRHQTDYHHLSEHMITHPDSLVSTAAYSTFSWMGVIFLTAIEFRGAEEAFRFGFVHIMLSYVILGIAVSKTAIFIKKNLVTEKK